MNTKYYIQNLAGWPVTMRGMSLEDANATLAERQRSGIKDEVIINLDNYDRAFQRQFILRTTQMH